MTPVGTCRGGFLLAMWVIMHIDTTVNAYIQIVGRDDCHFLKIRTIVFPNATGFGSTNSKVFQKRGT